MGQAVLVELTDAELHLLQKALDSHEYWQLSYPPSRNNGYSTIEDGENMEIDVVRALSTKLSSAQQQARPAAQRRAGSKA